MTFSALTNRRIHDAERGLTRVEPESIIELESYLRDLGDAIAANQSLDDLGEEENARGYEREKALWVKYRAAEKKLKELKDRAPP